VKGEVGDRRSVQRDIGLPGAAAERVRERKPAEILRFLRTPFLYFFVSTAVMKKDGKRRVEP